MALFDAFTGNAYEKAAKEQRAYYDQQGRLITGQIGGAQDQGLAALQSGQAGGLDAIRGGTATARGDISQFAPQALDYLGGYTDRAAGALTDAQGNAISALGAGVSTARGDYDPLASISGQYGARAGGASDIYDSIIGASDPRKAQAAFMASPGYKFALNEGLDSIARNANTTGMAAGGNETRAATEYATNAANQEWKNFTDNVFRQQGLYAPLEASTAGQVASGKSAAALTGGTGAANIYTGTGSRLADLYSNTGRTGSGILTGQGTSLADLAYRGGAGEADIFGTSGRSEADLIKGLTGLQVDFSKTAMPAYGSTYGAEAAAKTAADANLLKTGVDLAGLVAGIPPGTASKFLPTSGNYAAPYYQANYGSPSQLFPNYSA